MARAGRRGVVRATPLNRTSRDDQVGFRSSAQEHFPNLHVEVSDGDTDKYRNVHTFAEKAGRKS